MGINGQELTVYGDVGSSEFLAGGAIEPFGHQGPIELGGVRSVVVAGGLETFERRGASGGRPLVYHLRTAPDSMERRRSSSMESKVM